MEQLLHYIWRHRLYAQVPLFTTNNQLVEVIDPGLPNRNAGPDFFNAKLKIDGVLWVGNVEIHTHASDWYVHGHQTNPLYHNVILHVVEEADVEVRRADGEPVPQLVLRCPEAIAQRYEALRTIDNYPPCYEVIPTLSKLTVHAWLSALQVERFQQRAELILARLQRCEGDWETCLFTTLARNYGFGLNGDAFELWAGRLDFRAMAKHRNDLFQIEAFFFGQAGLLEEPLAEADDYYLKLQQEHRYLRHKFGLAAPIDPSAWRMLRLRPVNFPHVRIAQLAYLYHHSDALFSRLMEAETEVDALSLLQTKAEGYWRTHYLFNTASIPSDKRMGPNSLNLILINTVIPMLYAYGMHRGSEALCQRATTFLEHLKAEQNHIIRMWQQCGLTVECAADSQALIQLKKQYCDRHDCLRCRFGYEYLKGRAHPSRPKD